jgi:S-DNA-T family DNA segregation ATPase FtsK/SpoIIIE
MEIMISEQETVFFNDIIKNKEFIFSKANLPLALGRFRNGQALIPDLYKMPHMLVSGATGSGKSIILQSIINSLLVFSKNVNLVLIDLKRVEFSYYDDLPILYGPVARNVNNSIQLLESLIIEMNKRFFILEKHNARDILSYNGFMPFIVVIIDELADLMMASKKTVQELICKLAQKSRACGIHLIMATQRPSVDVVTGLIKANFPARISCKVSSATDSRTVLDKNGAETLVGKGDAIINCSEYSFKRFKGSFLNKTEILNIVNSRKSWCSRIWNS